MLTPILAAAVTVFTPAVASPSAFPVAFYSAPTTADFHSPCIARCQPTRRRVKRHRDPPARWSWPWSCIADHEGWPPGNPATDTGNGYYGGLQFTMQTWLAFGGVGNPADASIGEQEVVAERVLRAQGWGAWPNSSAACGL
jgi:Transglycosylase-like domain